MKSALNFVVWFGLTTVTMHEFLCALVLGDKIDGMDALVFF